VHELTNTQVNQRYANKVARACDRVFADLVQPVMGRDSLYSHLFRKIYATVATFFYCPTDVDEAEFRAEIQGHFSGYEGMTLAERRSIGSDRHYRSYIIQDQDGNMRKGIRLGWQGVEVIEAFRKSEQTIEEMKEGRTMTVENEWAPEVYKKRRTCSSLRTYTDQRDRWTKVLMAICPSCSNQQDKTSALLDWIEQHLDKVKLPIAPFDNFKGTERQLADADEIVAFQARTLGWLTREIESLRGQVANLQQERDELKIQLDLFRPSVEQLRDERDHLKLERNQALAKLEKFRSLLIHESTEASCGEIDERAAKKPNASDQEAETVPKTSSALKRVATEPQGATETDVGSIPIIRDNLEPGVVSALQAVMFYNNAQNNHVDKWAISFPVMKDLCKQIGVATQSKIDHVFKAKAGEIEQHHRQHKLGERHNRVHKGHSIAEFIQLR
jgi:hypothetical protein